MTHARRTPFNIITGFLGTGKTTAIRHLLTMRPETEEWAVLVNEFGEIGIDGALLQSSGVSVKEIPGGCMCCTNGLPVQIALNFLLARKPDRLIIEPSGLGHPDEILTLLKGPYYRETVEQQATLTLIDPRKLSDERYLRHELFQRQAAVADRLVATKTDLCTEEDLQRFRRWALQQPQQPLTGEIRWGTLSLNWLTVTGNTSVTPPHQDTPSPQLPVSLSPFDSLPAPWIDLKPAEIASTKRVRKLHQSEGFYSCGWRFPPDTPFDLSAILGWAYGLNATRLKGVFRTVSGACAINAEGVSIQTFNLPDAIDSRFEIIHTTAMDWDILEKGLLQCQVPGAGASPSQDSSLYPPANR